MYLLKKRTYFATAMAMLLVMPTLHALGHGSAPCDDSASTIVLPNNDTLLRYLSPSNPCAHQTTGKAMMSSVGAFVECEVGGRSRKMCDFVLWGIMEQLCLTGLIFY